MNNLSDLHVHALSDPRPYPIDYLIGNAVYPILICGIVNPYGPTLLTVAAVRDQTSAPLALVYSYLNPFRSELFVPGYLVEGQLGIPLPDQILGAVDRFELFQHGIPTLCLADSYLDEFDVRYLYGSLLAKAGDLRETFERLKRYPENPWDRVKEEMTALFGTTDSRPAASAAPLDESETEALLETLLSHGHNKAELSAFSYAWKGAIEEVKRHGNADRAAQAFQYDDFVVYLSVLLQAVQYEFE